MYEYHQRYYVMVPRWTNDLFCRACKWAIHSRMFENRALREFTKLSIGNRIATFI